MSKPTDSFPLVSIVTPVFNSQYTIQRCIDSVLAQNYSNWEHILVDDCSHDQSLHIIEEYQKKYNNVRLIRLKENKGPANRMIFQEGNIP